ncbi:MAG: DUF5674 family protein [bacterium]
MEIKIIKDKISQAELKKMAEESFGDMVKAVVDIEQKIMAVGGELHADAEAELLDQDCQQADLWGINIFPDKTGAEMIIYTSLINIRPSQNNRSMEIKDQTLKDKIRGIVDYLIE